MTGAWARLSAARASTAGGDSRIEQRVCRGSPDQDMAMTCETVTSLQSKLGDLGRHNDQVKGGKHAQQNKVAEQQGSAERRGTRASDQREGIMVDRAGQWTRTASMAKCPNRKN
ncbi:hypothetical protein NDU88_001250 [Pleurodeles waltl]|uniref:Uncharacterized protein n=1 Tax=Pleurodeles waltl TaxID=8319 RepID=A0AAV7TI83_PLEWA|nr:hypothetical protein NDU88_001250 [Pleurodeles waltl]